MADAEPVRVLVVDDEQLVLDTFALVLGPSALPLELGPGFDLTLCRLAEEAVAEARRALDQDRPFALALVDVLLRPGPDGLWCAEQLRKLDPHLQLVMMTGYDDPDLTETALRAPPLDRFLYLRKPIHRTEIQQLVANLAAKWRAEGEVRLARTALEARVAMRTAELAEANELLRQENASRLQVEQALRESERRYRDLFEGATDMLLVHDTAGRMLMANRTTIERLEYSLDELCTFPLADIIVKYDGITFTRRMQQVLEHGEARFESGLVARDGRVIPVEVCARPVDLDGERVILADVRDMTEHRRLEEQFRQAQKMEALGLLAGGLAHDLSNLLTVIDGHCQLLLDADGLPMTWRQEAEQVHTASSRARDLIQQLLVLSRRQPIELEVLDLSEVVRDLQPMLRRLVGERHSIGVQLTLQPVTVCANATFVAQILMNLVVNARDAMPDGGVVSLSLTVEEVGSERLAGLDGVHAGHFARLDVCDAGVGMSPEVLGHLFEPFFTTKLAGRGTGLGLATVYGLVRQLGGLIEVESSVGVGSEFRVLLPLAPMSAVAAAGSTHRLAPVAVGECTILVVEDERGVRDLAAHMLRRLGYRVLTAEGGAEALAVMAEHGPGVDLVLTDVIMPGMQGRELRRRLREAGYRARIQFMSGYSGEELSRGDDEPIDNLLTKPFSMQMLAHRVAAALEGE